MSGERYGIFPTWDDLTSSPITDEVNAPAHYTGHPSGVECIDITEHLSFLRGNAIKYLWRAGAKGDVLTDLRKAAYCVAHEIALIEKEPRP